jgi:tetraacyldisaccharide 4'-kinase
LGLGGLALSPLGWLYGGAVVARRALARPVKADVPVLCVGNLVLGGAGKTPVAIDLGRRLAARGKAVHFLTRGYGGTASGPLRVDETVHSAAEVGDEALLLARHGPTWMSADRPAGARAAVEAGAEVIVMDDGFQNPSLAKDLSLVVIDGAVGLGNGAVFPAGPLREPASRGLARAQAVVVVGDGWTPPPLSVPLLRARIRPDAQVAAHLRGKRVLAFAGIGRPEKFYATLSELGCDVVESRSFDDHHPFSADEIDGLLATARTAGAVPVTTEKDFVRLPEGARDKVSVLPIEVAWDDETAPEAVLDVLLEETR